MPTITVPVTAMANNIFCGSVSLFIVLSACRCSFSARCRMRALNVVAAWLVVSERRVHAGLIARLGEGDSSMGRARARTS